MILLELCVISILICFFLLMKEFGLFVYSFGGLLFEDPFLGPILYEYTHAFVKITLHHSKVLLAKWHLIVV